MTTFDTQYVAVAFTMLAETFGRAVTVNGTACTGIVDYGGLDVVGSDGLARRYQFRVFVSATDIPTVALGQSIVFARRHNDSTTGTFTIQGIIGQSGGVWELGAG